MFAVKNSFSNCPTVEFRESLPVVQAISPVQMTEITGVRSRELRDEKRDTKSNDPTENYATGSLFSPLLSSIVSQTVGDTSTRALTQRRPYSSK